MQMDTRVAIYLERVLYIITVEGDGSLTYRRCERMLQNTYLVVIDVDIGKDILGTDIHDITRLDEVIDTGRLLTLYDFLLVTRRPAVYLLSDRFVNTEWHDELTRQLALLDLFRQPGIFGKLRIGNHVGGDIVQGQRYLLVLGVLVMVTKGQFRLFLMFYHFTHQLHGRIVLATIAAALGLDGDLTQHLVVGFQGRQ